MNYQIVEEKIRNNEPFKHGNSMKAVVEGEEYRIYSYTTLIYSEEIKTGKLLYWDGSYFSHTTRKQQNLIKNNKRID